MPNLSIVNFNIVCATLGGFITLFGLISYLLKEKFYLSEALISTFAGVVVSPHATNWIRPLEYANNIEENLEAITLYFSRLVLGVQLVLAGVQLPSRYLKTEWKPLALLLGPGMCVMWLSTSLMVWAMVPDFRFLFALAVGSCVTPTDPVLSNSIVKGKFADKNIPGPLQKIVIAESGCNDGLGYPFLFLALYLIKYTDSASGSGISAGGAAEAMKLWFLETWFYVILLSVLYGAVVGYIAKELLHFAEERRYVDRESFLVFAIALALFIVGTVGLIGSDDVLACFVAGNVFTWDDWFRQETQDDSLQPTIDMLLNVSVFMWYGAVCPWHQFVTNDVIPIYRLIPLGIMVLLFRRIPMVLTYYYFGVIEELEDLRRALFIGFFGPIGVSAIFYLYVSREFLRNFDGRHDAFQTEETIKIVVWFLVICSIVVHGLSVPLGKLGFYLPQTFGAAISTERLSAANSEAREDDGEPNTRFRQLPQQIQMRHMHRRPTTSERGQAAPQPNSLAWIPRGIGRGLRHIFNDVRHAGPSSNNQVAKPTGDSDSSADHGGAHPEISMPTDARPLGKTVSNPGPPEINVDDTDARDAEEGNAKGSGSPSAIPSGTATPTSDAKHLRSIAFADDPRTQQARTPQARTPRDRSPEDIERNRGNGIDNETMYRTTSRAAEERANAATKDLMWHEDTHEDS